MTNPSKSSWGPQTRSVHAGEPPRHGVSAAVGVNICRTSTFTFSSTAEMKLWAEGKSKAYIYTRYGNPTLSVAQEKIAALEGAEDAVVTASGMAAISSSPLERLKAGDELISTRAALRRHLPPNARHFPNMGIKVQHVETDLAGMEEQVSPKTKVLYVETPTNPMLRLVDLQKAMALRQEARTRLHHRQHLRHAHPAESHRHGLRHGGAQCHQSAGRPFRYYRRSRCRQHAVDAANAAHGHCCSAAPWIRKRRFC